MSYIYRERERYEDDRPVSIKRYVIPSDEREDRREFSMSRDDYGDRELVIRRKTEREEPLTISRYEREVDYDPPARRFDREYERDYYDHRSSFASPRESDYDVVRRSDVEQDPYYYRHSVREYDRRSRREISPGDSISQASRRRHDRDQDYSSDDSIVYIHKETRDYNGERHHHKRHLAEGALVGAGAAELIRNHRKREGEEVSHGMSHAIKTAGAGALGAVAVNAAGHVRDYYRSKSRSRHRSHSFDDERSFRHSHSSRGRRSRSRSRSHSHSRAKTLMELGLGAAAVAAGVAALRSSKSKGDERRSRSRTRSRSQSRAGRGLSRSRTDVDDARSQSQRRKHMAGAGLAGAAVAGLVEKVRSRSRARKGEPSRSRSRLRKALPLVGAGLATAAATGLYEKNKENKEHDKEAELVAAETRRSRSRSRSRAPPDAYPDPSRNSAGLIEYGRDPVTGSIPAEHYYGQPVSPGGAYYSDGADAYGPRRHSRSRSRSRGGRYNDSSDSSDKERRSKKHRSRSRELASAALGATGLGYAAHKYSQHRERKKATDKERSRSRTRYEDQPVRDPYEEAYDPEPYTPSPLAPPHQQPVDANYPHNNYFPPPPGSTTNLHATPQPYNPADYPPPPGAAPPPQPYSYGGVGPSPDPYSARPRRADENVSAPLSSTTLPTDQDHARDGLNSFTNSYQPQSVPSPGMQPNPSSKSVAFDLSPDSPRHQDPGYETDDSDSTIDSYPARPRHNRRRSSSVPYPPMPHPRSNHHHHRHAGSAASSASRHQHSSHLSQGNRAPEQDSDSTVSTIELPDRFDEHGRRLPQRGDDPAADKIEELIEKFARVIF
ncbi:hypothetical protein N7462_009975 [Penicillium macrosclerotiorum]|uniref:uncharacterized protein n=1 Tax=Penicillium macrosclerotiorum TaxID=303699 RepID=UPI002547DD5D|nr:uncharacterized protein N7462_009975 [Penicillium macrosclerotiorum]KAJ5668905.1 hypothetical protein N7462_009975 [Penicillium macrosclerotiorum]